MSGYLGRPSAGEVASVRQYQYDQRDTPRPKVVSSPTGMEHYYRTALDGARTLCGKPVPQHRGWFGPIDRPATCARCQERAAKETRP